MQSLVVTWAQVATVTAILAGIVVPFAIKTFSTRYVIYSDFMEFRKELLRDIGSIKDKMDRLQLTVVGSVAI